MQPKKLALNFSPALILWMLIGCPFLASADTPRSLGPVQLNNQYALNAGHLSFPPQDGRIRTEGQHSLRVAGAVSNTSIVREDYIVDVENRQLEVEYTIGMAKDWDISLSFPLLWRGGGIFDGIIDDWHRAFDLPRGGRDLRDDDLFEIGGLTESGDFHFNDNGFALGNGRLEIGHSLISQPDRYLSLLGSLGLPSLGSDMAHRGVDLSVGAIFGQPIGPVWMHFGAAAIFTGDTDLSGVEYRPLRTEGFVALDYELFRNWHISAAFWSGMASVDNVSDHPNSFGYLDVGVKVATTMGVIELLVRENPWPQTGSPDVTGLLAFTYDFL